MSAKGYAKKTAKDPGQDTSKTRSSVARWRRSGTRRDAFGSNATSPKSRGPSAIRSIEWRSSFGGTLGCRPGGPTVASRGGKWTTKYGVARPWERSTSGFGIVISIPGKIGARSPWRTTCYMEQRSSLGPPFYVARGWTFPPRAWMFCPVVQAKLRNC